MERDYDFLHLYFSSTNTINKGVFLQVCDVFILEAFSQQCYFEVEKFVKVNQQNEHNYSYFVIVL